MNFREEERELEFIGVFLGIIVREDLDESRNRMEKWYKLPSYALCKIFVYKNIGI